MVRVITVPDYVLSLRLSEEADISIVTACILTYLHLCQLPLSAGTGLPWRAPGKVSDSTCALFGRYKRLACKYTGVLEFTEGKLRLKQPLPVSHPSNSHHTVNLSIGRLCLDRLQCCLPIECNTAKETWAEYRTVCDTGQPTQHVLDAMRRCLRIDYNKRREALQRQLDDLDQTWDAPVKSLEAAMRAAHPPTEEAERVEVERQEHVPSEEVDDKQRDDKQHYKKKGESVKNHKRTSLLPNQEGMSTLPDVAKKASLDEQARAKMRSTWRKGERGAVERVLQANLTAQHVSNPSPKQLLLSYWSLMFSVAQQAFKLWIRALYPEIGGFSMDNIGLEFPQLEELYEEGLLRLRNPERPEIESTFIDAYDNYLREEKEKKKDDPSVGKE